MFTSAGRGDSAEIGDGGVLAFAGMLDGRATVLLYPSRESAKVEARYHCTTCSGRGAESASGLKGLMALEELVIEQLATRAAKTVFTDRLSPTIQKVLFGSEVLFGSWMSAWVRLPPGRSELETFRYY